MLGSTNSKKYYAIENWATQQKMSGQSEEGEGKGGGKGNGKVAGEEEGR